MGSFSRKSNELQDYSPPLLSVFNFFCLFCFFSVTNLLWGITKIGKMPGRTAKPKEETWSPSSTKERKVTRHVPCALSQSLFPNKGWLCFDLPSEELFDVFDLECMRIVIDASFFSVPNNPNGQIQ